MAVDAKSAIGVAHPSLLNFPVPYTASQANLQDVAYSYAGILAGEILPGRVSRVLTLWPTHRTLTLDGDPATLTLWPSPRTVKAGSE